MTDQIGKLQEITRIIEKLPTTKFTVKVHSLTMLAAEKIIDALIAYMAGDKKSVTMLEDALPVLASLRAEADRLVAASNCLP